MAAWCTKHRSRRRMWGRSAGAWRGTPNCARSRRPMRRNGIVLSRSAVELEADLTNAASVDEARKPTLAEAVYRSIKRDIFDYRLLPGDRFTEGEVAARLNVSRTPVREGLQRLEKEGYLHVHF